MDGDNPGRYPYESDDSDGQETVEYGGRRWKKLREDPRHEAFNRTGLNLSQVLSVIYEVSHGINYHTSKHLVKCGVHGETQVRNSFETLLKLGHYDDITKYVRPDALVTESLPTADSGSRNQYTYDPDGSMKAMLLRGWFSKGGVGENWKRAFMPSVNVDTGLTEPLKLNVFKHTAAGIPTFKHSFKRKSVFTNRKKCIVCYTSMKQAFEDQEAYFRAGGEVTNHADEMEARQRPVSMGFIGVGFWGVSGEGQGAFEIPLWVKFFTSRFTGIEHLYRMVYEIVPDIVERIHFWMSIAALNHELTLEDTGEHTRLMFHVYSFRDFVYSVQAGRFNDLVLLARKSEEKNARDYNNETLLTRLRKLLTVGETRDFDSREITLEDYTNLKAATLDRLLHLESSPGWVAVFDVVGMDVPVVSSSVEALLVTDSIKLKFMKKSFDFLAVAGIGFRWIRFTDGIVQTHPVQSLKDFVDAILAKNFDGILSSLHAWGAAFVKSLNRPPDFDLIFSNIEALCFLMQRVIVSQAGVTFPLWLEMLSRPLDIGFTKKILKDYGNTEEDKLKLRDFKERLAELYALYRSLTPGSSLRYNQRNIVPVIDSFNEFFVAVLDRRFDSLLSQMLNSFNFSYHLMKNIVLQNFEVLIVPRWIITLSQRKSIDVVYTLLHRFSEGGEMSHEGIPQLKSGGIPLFRSHLVDLLQRVKNSDTTWDVQLDRKITPYIDTFPQFVAALMDLRFDDLVAQVLVSSRSSRYYNLSLVMYNCNQLILKINEEQPLIPVPSQLPDPGVGPEPKSPVHSPESGDIRPSSPAQDPDDNGEAQKKDRLYHRDRFADGAPEFYENWVSRINEPYDGPGIEKLFQECVDGLNIQERLNFVRNLGEFIKVLSGIERGENAELYLQYKLKRTRPKKINFFAREISMKRYPRLIGSILKCIGETISDKDYWESLKHDPSVRFNPGCSLDFIVKTLGELHVKGLELTNRVFYTHSEFVTPQWVLDFMDPEKQDDEAVNMLYGDLLSYLPGFAFFDSSTFLKCLGTMLYYSERYSFRGILIKTPIVTMSDIVASISGVHYNELCATVFYDPSGPNPGRYARFLVRFKLFSEYCQTHLKIYFQEKVRKDREEFERMAREREAERNKVPRDLYHAPSWMQKVCSAETSFEIIHLWNQTYDSYEQKFLFWKSLEYFVYRIDGAYSIKDRQQSSPITKIEVFVQAVADKRFDDLLYYVHTYAKSESTKELMTTVLGLVLQEMKAQADDESVKYGVGFKDWKDARDRSRGHVTHTVHGEQDDSSPVLTVKEDQDAVELSDWLAYKPLDFEILIDDDKMTVGRFEWVFDLIGFTSLNCARYTLELKDLRMDSKKLFFEKLPKFIKYLEEFSSSKESSASAKHKDIYKWRDFVVAVAESTNFVHLAKILYLCDGKRLDRRRFFVAMGITKLREIYDHLKTFMDRTTPVKTTFENALIEFRGQDYQLVTHRYPTAVMMVGESVQKFVVKTPVKTVRDSLFGCIKDSMINLLNSGVKPYFLFFPPFFKDFQRDTAWCDKQRPEILNTLLNSVRKVEIYHSETRTKSTQTVKQLVLRKYFPNDSLRVQSSEAIRRFTDGSRLAEMVDNELMQLISDRYNLTIVVTYPNLVKKIRRRRTFQNGGAMLEAEMTLLKASHQKNDGEDREDSPAVPLPEPHEYNVAPAPPPSEEDVFYEEIADTISFTPEKEQLPWEDYDLYSKRRFAYKVKIYLKYCRGEPMADGTTYTGYQTLIDAEMTEVFAFSKIDNVMQRNVVDMLLKLQKQCAFGDHEYLEYNSKAFNVPVVEKRPTRFYPKYDFFKFPVPEDFLVRLVSQALLGDESQDNDLHRGWTMFVEHLQMKQRVTSPRPGSAQVDLVNKVDPNMECFEFDNFAFSAGPATTVDKQYWVRGLYDYTEVEKNWRTALYNNQDWNRHSGFIFDSVQLTRPDNALLPKFAVDLVFESVHLTAVPEKENEAQFYLTCIWISLLSYVFHPSVVKVPEVELSKEQYYFVIAVIARQNSVKEFREFVLELCKRNKTDIEQELLGMGEESETAKKKKLEHLQACTEVISQLGDSSTGIEFNASHKKEIATVLNLMIIESELTHDMKLSPDRAHFVVRSRSDFVGRDSFYINPSVFPVPSLFKDPVRFMIRKDFAPVALSNDVFKVQISEYEMLEEFEWRCGEPRSLFACIAETCFLAQDPKSDKQELMYANQLGEPDKTLVHEDLMSVLNRIFEWYCQGLKIEERNLSAEADTPSTIAINESFYKVKSIITYIVDYHWNSIAMILNSQRIDNLPVFSGVVTVNIWDAFLKFSESDEYVPGLFEMQILADYLCISICVFKVTGFTTMEVKLDSVDGKKVPFVFMPLVSHSGVLAVAETIDGNFQIMSPKSTTTAAKPSFSQPFFVTRTVSERFKSITCMRPTKRISDYNECSLVLGPSLNFYNTLALFLHENKTMRIPRINIFRHVESISNNALMKIVDVYIFNAAEIFSVFFTLHGNGGNSIEIHEFLTETADAMKAELQDQAVSKRDVISWIKKNNAGILHMFASKFYNNPSVLQQLSDELGSIEKRSTFRANFHAILAEDDFEDTGRAGKYLSELSCKAKTFEQLKKGMQRWLTNVNKDVRKSILYHHYGKTLREEREKYKKSKDMKDRFELFEKELWKTYCTEEFYQKIPSEFEFEQVAMMLDIRLMVFSDEWTRSTRKMLKYKGTLERLYDTGLNTQNPLVILIGRTSVFSIMMFNKPIELRSVKEISRLTYEGFVENCKTKWIKEVTALADGKSTTTPKDPVLYKLIGVNPNASSEDIMGNLSTGRVRKPLLFLHPDKMADFINGTRTFTPILGEFGPQTLEEVNKILDYFESNLGFTRDKAPEMVDLAWQTITNEIFRYLYHAKLSFLPFSMRRPFNPGEVTNGDGKPKSLGEHFEKWSFGHGSQSDASLVEQSTYYQNFIKRIPVFIQIKSRYPDYQKFNMKSSNEKQWDYGGILSNILRNKSVASFESRFNVSQRWGDDGLPSNKYAVMLPVKKSFSSVNCRSNEYKVYITRNTGSNEEELIMSRINIFSTVLHGEIPDMKTQKPSPESDFEAKAKWSNDWCGLKMCIQTAFFFARHNSFFKKFLLQQIGNTEDLFRFDWLDTFLTPNQEDDWSLYASRNTNEETLNYTGITNPFNVNYSTLRDAIHILYMTGEKMGIPGEHHKKVSELLSKGESFFNTVGKWDTDENISAFFEQVDFDNKFDDNRARSESKRKKSTILMRFLGMAFNVEFVILKSFIENDVNSLTFDDNDFYYYTVRENGQDVKIRDLTHSFINRRGLNWCSSPTYSTNIFQQKLLSTNGVESSPVKACPLPVFVIWENDKWNILRWKSFHDVGVAEELMRKKYEDQKMLREKVKAQKELKFGGDWKGKILIVGGGNNSQGSSGNGGLGHFSADECDEGSSDSGSSSDWDDSDDDDWSDSDDGYWDGDSDDDMEGKNRRDRFNNYRHGDGRNEPKPLWGRNMPRSLPSRRSEYSGGGSGGGPAPRGSGNRGWETRSKFSLSARRPGRRVCDNGAPPHPESARHVSFDEDQKEIHFMSQKVPMAVNVLKYLTPYGCCDLKLQSGQMEQTKILAVIFACCFDQAIIIPIKRCYTTRMMVACKGLRKDLVALLGVRQMLKRCFDLKESSFHNALSELYKKRIVPSERIDELMQQVQSASDELWADDFRCSLIMARTYIQATLEGKVSPASEYLSPELADMLNRRVFSHVTPEQRRMNQEMIRTLMKSNIGDQLLPLFRVVFHPDLHTWRLTLPKNYKKVAQTTDNHDAYPTYWQWDVPACASAAAVEFRGQRAWTRNGIQL